MQWTGWERVEQLGTARPPDLEYQDLQPAAAPPTAAVDGSHAVLVDNGAHFVVAVRATGIHWSDTEGRSANGDFRRAVPLGMSTLSDPSTPDVPTTTHGATTPGDASNVHVPSHAAPPKQAAIMALHAATADDAAAQVEARCTERGLPTPRIHGAESFAETLRGLAELDAAVEAIRLLPEGGLLLVDGALDGLPELPQAMADRLLDRATASGVHLAGISKRSGLTVEGQPVLPGLAQRRGRWWAPVPGHTARVAKLHPLARHAFRIDAEDGTLPWLADMARDAVYLGYPYPLAKVHNEVAISRQEARRLAEGVHRKAGHRAGLQDFHEVLDRNAPR